MAQIGQTFRAGETVPDSGVYDVVHDQHHRPNHQLMCRTGLIFPRCSACQDRVQFGLAIKVPAMEDDADFGLGRAENPMFEPAA